MRKIGEAKAGGRNCPLLIREVVFLCRRRGSERNLRAVSGVQENKIRRILAQQRIRIAAII